MFLVPHTKATAYFETLQDDFYAGYFIPKGTRSSKYLRAMVLRLKHGTRHCGSPERLVRFVSTVAFGSSQRAFLLCRAMNHDTTYFDDPNVFKPERYLDSEGRRKEPISDTHGHDHGTFGSGRRYVLDALTLFARPHQGVRICVGRDLAQQALFIYIATVLWAADISPSSDAAAVLPSPTTLEDKGIVA